MVLPLWLTFACVIAGQCSSLTTWCDSPFHVFMVADSFLQGQTQVVYVHPVYTYMPVSVDYIISSPLIVNINTVHACVSEPSHQPHTYMTVVVQM